MGIKKNRRWINILILCIALLLVASGMVMLARVFSHYGEVLLEQQDDQLFDIVYSAKRSLKGQVERYRTDLEYVVERRGFLEAEELWRAEGAEDELLFRMQENLLTQDPLIVTMLALRGDEIVLSTNGELGYRFPQTGNADLRPCVAEDGTLFLALFYDGHEGITYAALMDLGILYRNVAGEVNEEEREHLLLMDAGGKVLIHTERNQVRISELDEMQPGACDEDELALMQRCLASEQPETVSYTRFDEIRQENYEARMAAVPVGANGFFVVGITTDYEATIQPMHKALIRLLIYGGVFAVGVLMLLGWALHALQRNSQVIRELRLLQEKNDEMQRLVEKTQELSHHQRLETIGTMTSSIAHEFNNLLTPIMGYSMMTLEALPPEQEELYDNVLEIYNASRKAKTIIARLGELSRKNTAMNFLYVSPDELMEKVISVALPAKPGSVSVEKALNCHGLWLYGNETQLSQLLLNLILNAFHAMAQSGGVLTLATGREQDTIVFTVADTGPGIPEESRDQIFDPFFTTKESGAGTGLGLAIAQQVASEHNGSITFKSAVGEGTAFSAAFPLSLDREREQED